MVILFPVFVRIDLCGLDEAVRGGIVMEWVIGILVVAFVGWVIWTM